MAFYNNSVPILRAESEVATGAILGGLIGGVQTFVLREFVDIPMAKTFLKNTSGTPPLLMAQLAGFGSVSALSGIVAGGAALVIGLVGMLKGKVIKKTSVSAGLASYGAVALSTGVLSGAFPTAAWSSAVSVDPSNPISREVVSRNKPVVSVGVSSTSGLLGA